jgi:hypothetical protein
VKRGLIIGDHTYMARDEASPQGAPRRHNNKLKTSPFSLISKDVSWRLLRKRDQRPCRVFLERIRICIRRAQRLPRRLLSWHPELGFLRPVAAGNGKFWWQLWSTVSRRRKTTGCCVTQKGNQRRALIRPVFSLIEPHIIGDEN